MVQLLKFPVKLGAAFRCNSLLTESSVFNKSRNLQSLLSSTEKGVQYTVKTTDQIP